MLIAARRFAFCYQSLLLTIPHRCLRFTGAQPKVMAVATSSTSSKLHKNCISGTYPGSSTKRQTVADDRVKWVVPFPDYDPPKYTSEKLKKADYADKEIGDQEFQPHWNAEDNGVNRKSYEGDYLVVDDVPQNPVGRTGLKGRGKLGKWGPNHAGDPIVTRWKTDKNGNVTYHISEQKPILQVAVIKRGDSGDWAFPGGMVDKGEKVEDTIKREFKEECLEGSDLSDDEKVENRKLVESHFKNGTQVYRGYVDDPRNTDNAWMETVAINYQDQTGAHFAKLKLRAGSDAKEAEWKDVSSGLKLYANHDEILRKVAQNLNARW